MSHVFISYASEDHKLADRLRDQLEFRGVRCWIAPRDIRPGDVYADAIVQAIEAADGFVLLLTRAANESNYVFRELELASACQRRVVPVLVAGVDPSRRFRFFIASHQWLRATTADDVSWIEDLARTLGGREPAEPSDDTDTVHDDLEPTGDRARSTWKRRPGPWLAVGAAVVLALLLAALALRWDGDGGSTSEERPPDPTTTEGPGLNPGANDVATLRRHVPFTGCEKVQPEERGETAELYCSSRLTGLGGAWYELDRTKGDLVDRYEGLRRTSNVERGAPGTTGCAAKLPAESTYDIGKRDNQGRLLCFEAGGKLVFAWSRYDRLIVAITQVSGSTRARVFEWWTQKAGPS